MTCAFLLMIPIAKLVAKSYGCLHLDEDPQVMCAMNKGDIFCSM